jgi:hypothetical protein
MLSLPQVCRGAEPPAVGGCEVIAIEGTVGPDSCTYQTNSTIGQTVVVTPYQSLECSSAVQNYHQYPLGSVTLRVLAGVGWARDK